MVRQIAADTGAPAELLSALNRLTFNTPTDSLVDARHQDVDELIADHVHDLEDEHRRLYIARL